MKRIPIILAILFLLPLLLAPAAALGQNVDYRFHWAPSPLVDQDGVLHMPAVAYEVWVQRDAGIEERVAVVTDTLYLYTAEPGVVQRLRVCGLDEQGRSSPMSEWSSPVYFEDDQRNEQVPPLAELGPNYPNPFNPETNLTYAIPATIAAADPVSLEIYNLRGRRVRTLPVERTPGWHEVLWDGTDDAGHPSATGMYVSRYVCGTLVETGKMTLLK